MHKPAKDNWWRNRDTTWWQSLIIGVLLDPHCGAVDPPHAMSCRSRRSLHALKAF
jgi:hypothetical protein